MANAPSSSEKQAFKKRLSEIKEELAADAAMTANSQQHRLIADEIHAKAQELERRISDFEKRSDQPLGKPAANWFIEQRVSAEWAALMRVFFAPVGLWATVGAFLLGVHGQVFLGENAVLMFQNPLGIWISGFQLIGIVFLISCAVVGFRAKEKSIQRENEFRLGSLSGEWSRLVTDREKMLAEYRNWKNEQQEKLAQLARASTSSKMNAKAAAAKVSNADSIRNQADSEFKKGALVTFWDHIEKCIEAIAESAQLIDAANRDRLEFSRVLVSYRGSSPVSCAPISYSTLDEVRETVHKVSALIRELAYNAQFNPSFAQIYEMRRNTATLVAGFKSLGDAIKSLGDRIEASIGSLQTQVSNDLRRIEDSVLAVEEAIYSSASVLEGRIEASSDEAQKVSSVFAKAVEMTEENNRFTRAALVEGIRTDHEVKVMLAGITEKVSPSSLAHVRGLYGTILDPGPRIPR